MLPHLAQCSQRGDSFERSKMPYTIQFPIQAIGKEPCPFTVKVLCPECGFDYVHLETVDRLDGQDNYATKTGVRGNATQLRCFCEHGHKFMLGFGSHKGNLYTWWEPC